MGLFDDLSRFLENRLEEFLRNNPHLELEALLEQLRRARGRYIKVDCRFTITRKAIARRNSVHRSRNPALAHPCSKGTKLLVDRI